MWICTLAFLIRGFFIGGVIYPNIILMTHFWFFFLMWGICSIFLILGIFHISNGKQLNFHSVWFDNVGRASFALIQFFSHTQRVSVTLAITLCPSSLLLLSSLLLSSLSAWTFLVFQLLLSNRCTDLLQILCGCSLGGPLLSLLKSWCYPHFSWNYG